MDVLKYLPYYRTVVCKACGTAVPPRSLLSHLRRLHVHEAPTEVSFAQTHQYIDQLFPSSLNREQLLQPGRDALILPPADTEALPYLTVYEGLGCNYCPFVCARLETVKQHYNTIHAYIRRTRGGVKAVNGSALRAKLDREHYRDEPAWHPAVY